MLPIQVWRRSTKPCAVQGGAEFPTWNTHANPQQREAHLPTRNTEKGTVFMQIKRMQDPI